jgi:hypothetical protein
MAMVAIQFPNRSRAGVHSFAPASENDNVRTKAKARAACSAGFS